MDDGVLGELHAAVHEPLLGTRVTVRLRAADMGLASAAELRIVTEIERLEAMLSAYRTDSEWSQWRRGELEQPGPELAALLALAAHWHTASSGAFNPSVGVLRQRWLRAAKEGIEPSPAEMAELAESIRTLPFRFTDGGVERCGDCSHLDLHAIAKGWIVDRAVATVTGLPGISEVLVNAGGDLLHRGARTITVGIEDPRRPFDNVPPLVRVTLHDAGMASSSGARRPMVVGGTKYSHVLDPFTGWPVRHVLAATALAPDAATADVLATVAGVLPITDGLRMVDSVPGASCLLLDGAFHTSRAWPHHPAPVTQAPPPPEVGV